MLSIPGGGLHAHEGPGHGHTISKHVDKTSAELTHRIATEGRDFVSSFPDLQTAENAVLAVLRAHEPAFQAWISSTSHKTNFKANVGFHAGVVMDRFGQQHPSSRVIVVLRKKTSAPGYFILTAYPIL